eukprot:6011711-Amphidinium_carterae.1
MKGTHTLAALIPKRGALDYAADCLLEDPTFATEAKRQFHLLKLTMLSGRSMVVTANGDMDVEEVLQECHRRLNLADDGAAMELWDLSGEKVPDDEEREVRDWPGLQPTGEISEYQLVLR